MKRLFAVAGWMLILTGCVRVEIPQYVQDELPYKKSYFADFDETLIATESALKKLDWEIAERHDPIIFESNTGYDQVVGRQILLFTKEKQASRFLYSRYFKLNVYVRSLGDSTEVEIRYIAITPVVKSFKSYKNDPLIERIFNQIATNLEQ